MSEKRPVGSLRRDKDALLDLMGDEGTGAGPAGGAAAAAVPAQSAQDLLADIFGSGDAAPAAAAAAPSQKQSDPVNDIMSLFGSTSISPQPTGPAPSSASPSNDLFSAMSVTPAAPVAAAAAAPPPAPVQMGPQALEAYNRNGLRITLTPVRDSNNRMVVNVLAKFTSTQPVSSVNFQAAVPKVSPTPVS